MSGRGTGHLGTTLGTALRGLRSRALLSLGSLVLIVIAVGGTVLGPMFEQASSASYTLTRVAATPAPLTALTWEVHAGTETDLDSLVRAGVTQAVAVSPTPYASPDVTVTTTPFIDVRDNTAYTLLARDGACAILEVRGRCPERPGEVLVNETDLGAASIGDPVTVPGVGVSTIVGTYATPTTDAHWLLPSLLSSSPASRRSPARLSPYIVSTSDIAALDPRVWVVRLDARIVVPDQLGDDAFDRLVADTGAVAHTTIRLPDGGRLLGRSDVNALPSVLADVRAQRAAARSAVGPAVLSLILVALAMILRLQTSAAELRIPELALASLRGVGRRRTWLLGLLEPWLLVAVGTPLGIVAGYAATGALGRAWLRPGIGLGLPAEAWLGAVLVGVVTAGVAAVALGGVLSATLGSQLAGTRRPGRSTRFVVLAELVVVLLAVMMAAVRLGSGAGTLDVTVLLLPVVAAVAAGLLVTRATTLAASRWTSRRTGGPLAVFVAARAVARRSQGTLVMLPVAAAIGVAVFAVGVSATAASWRSSVADTQAPADVTYASPLSVDATDALVLRLDPGAQWAMMMATFNQPTGAVLLADTARLARMTSWSSQWLDGAGAGDVARLLVPDGTAPSITGRRVGLDVDNEAGGRRLTVQLDLLAGDGAASVVYLGPYPAGKSTADAAVACGGGCRVQRITVGGAAGLPVRMRGRVTLGGLTADGTAVTDAFTASAWGVAPTTGSAADGVTTDGSSLVVSVGGATGTGVAAVAPGDVDAPLATIVGADAAGTLVPADGDPSQSAVDLNGSQVVVREVASAASMPLLGPSGVMVDLDELRARQDLLFGAVSPYVMVRADAPSSVTDALARHGLVVDATHDDVRQALDDSAYAQALRLYRAVAVTILALALGGLLVSIASQLPARRRDAAALRVVGVRRRTVTAASFWESAVVLGAAVAAGLVAGLVSEALLLRSLTLGVVDDPHTPAVQRTIDVVPVVLLGVGVTVVLVTVSLVTSVRTVGRARAATLRESAR